MDTKWERAIPINDISLETIRDIFSRWDKTLVVQGYKVISLGCRNSNYIVTTQRDKHLLRISPDRKCYQNEINVYKKVADIVNVPKLYHNMELDDSYILIYEYIQSVSLQSVFEDSSYDKKDAIAQVATALAKIHNLGIDSTYDLMKLDIPPYETWYGYFLDNSNVTKRLGGDITSRVRKLIEDNKQSLAVIDSYQSLIHSDFRPANMLVDKNNDVYIVDWEYACKGHTLADVGQFFRYGGLFSTEDIECFKTHYDKVANVKLPDNFFKLSKIRDLVNPLQMLSSDADKPVMYRDLTSIIRSTLEYFIY